MAVKSFLNTDYQEMEVLGVKGLFTNMRIDRESLPKGFYKYSFRDGDDDFLSTVEGVVMANHMGDFICKTPLRLDEDGSKELRGEYHFTDSPVNLDTFFGVDILDKVAAELDKFMREIAPYEYADNLDLDQENMVDDIRAMLNDREQAEGILQELIEICDEVPFADKKSERLAEDLRDKVRDVVGHFPERHEDLAKIIAVAEDQKEKAQAADSQIEPEVTDF